METDHCTEAAAGSGDWPDSLLWGGFSPCSGRAKDFKVSLITGFADSLLKEVLCHVCSWAYLPLTSAYISHEHHLPFSLPGLWCQEDAVSLGFGVAVPNCHPLS